MADDIDYSDIPEMEPDDTPAPEPLDDPEEEAGDQAADVGETDEALALDEDMAAGEYELAETPFDEQEEASELRGVAGLVGEDAAAQDADPLPEPQSDAERLRVLELEVRRLQELIAIPSPFPRVFIAQKNTDGTWTETISVAGTLTPSNDWRNCTSSSAAWALTIPTATSGSFATVLEMDDPPNKRYFQINATSSSGTTLLYAKTATGDTLSSTGSFASVASAFTMTLGAVYRLHASISTATNPGGLNVNGPVLEVRLTTGSVLLATAPANVLLGSGGYQFIDLSLEFTIIDATHANLRFVSVNNEFSAAGTLVSSPVTLSSTESLVVSASTIFIKWASGSGGSTPLLTLNTLTLERLS